MFINNSRQNILGSHSLGTHNGSRNLQTKHNMDMKLACMLVRHILMSHPTKFLELPLVMSSWMTCDTPRLMCTPILVVCGIAGSCEHCIPLPVGETFPKIPHSIMLMSAKWMQTKCTTQYIVFHFTTILYYHAHISNSRFKRKWEHVFAFAVP